MAQDVVPRAPGTPQTPKSTGSRPAEQRNHDAEHRYPDYTHQLTLVNDFLASLRRDGLNQTFKIVEFNDLTDQTTLPGKNNARVVVGAPFPPSRHVFKGFDFASFLKHGPYFHEHQQDTMLHEIRTLAALPAHPNIMPCPEILVVVRDPDGGDARVCGFLQPVMDRETLDDQVIKANLAGRRISLSRKAKWSHGLARAVLHTHRVGGTYHMDVKPGNTLIDDSDAVRLIDWEQSGVSMFTHSKEVTVDQEAREEGQDSDGYKTSPPEFNAVSNGTPNGSSKVITNSTTNGYIRIMTKRDTPTKNKPRIIYTRHDGPERSNLPWGYPDWNVFPEWKRTCPRAAELAEVFSIGRVMWMFMEQVEQSRNPTKWTDVSKDIPQHWKDLVMRCQNEDPNQRPDLDELVDFWQREMDLLIEESTNGNGNSICNVA